MEKYRKLFIIIVFVLLFLMVTSAILYRFYISPVSKIENTTTIKVEKGMTSRKIGTLLYKNKLIKNETFFLLYLKLNNVNDLKSGTYKLSPNMSLKDIVKKLQDGNSYNEETISITFKEGINYREMARVISENTNNSYEDVLNILNNNEYIDSLISDYWFLTDDIKNSNIYYSLEGYLSPNTYEFRSRDVTVPEIFKKLLDQTDLILSAYELKIKDSKFSIHELLTLASIAEKEVSNPLDRANVISVFVNRLNKKMSLGSDITTRYGLKLDDKRPLTKSEYNSSNPYNTRNISMLTLPASPICMISKSSIEASLNYEETNYLYFISNIETNETFFFETSKEFENKKNELSKVNKGY